MSAPGDAPRNATAEPRHDRGHDPRMRLADLLDFAWQVVRGYRTRTLLILLAMGIGVAAVVAVTSLGEGARLYVVNQFGSLGTNPVLVLPGRTQTAGGRRGG